MMPDPSLAPLTEEPWPKESLTQIAQATAALLGASRVWVLLRDAQGAISPHIVVAAERLTTPLLAEYALRATPPLISVVVEQFIDNPAPRPLAFTDIHTRLELLSLAGPDAAQIHSLAATALLNEDEVVGALVVSGATPGLFTSEAPRLTLETLAGQAVAAIRLTLAAERNAAQATELNALLGATQALTITLDSDEVFRAVIQSIQRVIAYESALIYRYDERDDTLRVMTGLGLGQESLQGDVIPVQDPKSRAAWVARHKKAYFGPVGPEDTIGAHTDKLRAGGVVSLLYAPLISKGRLRGVASLARSEAFTQRELNVMERLSPIAATALENVELYRAEQAARQQQEALFASASDGFALLDESLRLLQVNQAFGMYVARDPSELVGQLCCSVLGAQTGATLDPRACLICRGAGRCLLRDVSVSRIANDHLECAFPPPPEPPRSSHASIGQQVIARTIDFSATPVQGPEGRPRLLLVGRDVSGPREVERFRAEQIHMVSHEMGAPLQTIVSCIDHFINIAGQSVPAEQLKFLQTAQATTQSMSGLVDDLDLLARRDANQWTIYPRPTDLAAEAHGALVEMRLVAQEKGITLHEQVIPQTPLALVDPARARQVARNLIGNAIKFTPSGGEARIAVYSEGKWVTLRVEDTGPGVPEEARLLIWNRFYRVPQPEGAPYIAGRGLGLAIVRIIVEKHGGDYDVQRGPHGGAIFLIRFPRADRSLSR